MLSSKFRTTLILVVVFAVLLAFVWFFEKDREVKKEGELETYNVITINKDEVKEVVFEYGDQKTKVVKEGNDWQLAEPIKYQARDQKIEDIIEEIDELEANQLIESDDLSEFGLDEPEVKVLLVMDDNSTKELLVGNDNPQETSVYIKADDTIYLTAKTIRSRLKLNEEVLKED